MVYFCCVNGCKTEWYPGGGLSFHRIPMNEIMAERWKKSVPGKVTKTSVICNLHFKDTDFINPSRKRLKPTAVPSIFPKILTPEKKVHVLSSLTLVEPAQEPSTSEPPEKKQKLQKDPEKSIQTEELSANTPRKRKLKREIKVLSQRLKRRNTTIHNLKSLLAMIKKKCDCYSEVEEMIQINFKNIHEEINANKSNRGARYTNDLKSFALTLYYYSAKAYLFLRNHIALPHPATLRRVLSMHNCNVGFMSEVFEFLKQKASQCKDINNVALIFDSMSIKTGTNYEEKNDKWWGTIDFGGIAPTDPEKLASEALVFQIVSLKEKFKCPIAYFFVDKISADIQAQLISTALRMLADINIIVRALTSDGAVSNVKTYRILGCNLDYPNIQSFFKHPSKDNINVHCILDPVHMIKLARNVFAETSLSSEKGEIKFDYIKKLQKLQEEEGLKLANKISRAHINFFGKKMNVRLAVQVLSSSVADALDFLRCSGHTDFLGSEATIEYLRYLDRIFDLLDSKNPFGTGFKSPLRPNNKDIWLSVFQETREYLSKLKVDGQNILMHKRKTPALGIIMDTFSYTNLATDLFAENALNYLLTHKTSQDHLELFFSCVRACGRTNDNPDALQFMYIMRKLLFRNSVKPTINANCTDEDYDSSPILEFRSAKRSPSTLQNSNYEQNETDKIDSLMQLIDRTTVSDFKINILYYISGYIVGKMLAKMSCEYCKAALITKRDHEDHVYFVDICHFSSFTAFVDRGGLKYASRIVFEIVKYAEKLFLTLSMQLKKNLNKNYMMNIITQHFYTQLKDIPHPVQSRTTESKHEIELIKCIVNKYLNMRLKTYAKEDTHDTFWAIVLQCANDYIKQFYLVTFK